LTEKLWIGGTLLLGLLAAGLPLWPIAYENLSLTSAGFVLAWICTGVLAGGIAGRFSPLPRLSIGLFVACGFVAAVLARVIVDGLDNSTSHSYWPFETVITIIISTPSALLGAYLGRKLRERAATAGEESGQM
jgi:uncharacterized membrane protein YeaQ/YmgE (transglycosylase-associated protein family)